MMKRALISLILLAIVVGLSGCPETPLTTGPASTNGIIIKDFGFDYSPIYAEESTGLTLTLQNVGGEEGTLRQIEIFGVDAPTSNAGTLTWGWGSGDDFKLEDGVELVTVELLPPDPTTGFEGEEYFAEWVPEAPSAITAPTTYDFQSRVMYEYTTTFTGKIQVVHNDYLRSLPAEEREALIKVGGVQDASVTGGPLSLTAASGRHFIVRSGDMAESRSIKFKITNVGSGYPYNSPLPLSDSNLHYVTISGVDGITCSDTSKKLARGKTAVLSCDFTSPADGTFTNKVDKMFSITLSYGYYVDSAASITVNPILD